MEIKNTKTGKKRILFDAVKDGQNICPKWVPPEDEQEPNESRRYASWPGLCNLVLMLQLQTLVSTDESDRGERHGVGDGSQVEGGGGAA